MKAAEIEQIYFELADNLTETLLQAVGSEDMDGRTTLALWIKDNMPRCKGPINEEELDRLANKVIALGDAEERVYTGSQLKEIWKLGYIKAKGE